MEFAPITGQSQAQTSQINASFVPQQNPIHNEARVSLLEAIPDVSLPPQNDSQDEAGSISVTQKSLGPALTNAAEFCRDSKSLYSAAAASELRPLQLTSATEQSSIPEVGNRHQDVDIDRQASRQDSSKAASLVPRGFLPSISDVQPLPTDAVPGDSIMHNSDSLAANVASAGNDQLQTLLQQNSSRSTSHQEDEVGCVGQLPTVTKAPGTVSSDLILMGWSSS